MTSKHNKHHACKQVAKSINIILQIAQCGNVVWRADNSQPSPAWAELKLLQLQIACHTNVEVH